MCKIAIFVEGQTEQIVLRELLLRKYEYVVNIDCRTLFTDSKFREAPYDYKNPATDRYFQIINVGNDNAVLSRILKREKLIWSEGFSKIVALRDMYSRDYRDFSTDICLELIDKFKSGIAETISKNAVCPDNIIFCHAIMETEAWFLGLPQKFCKLNEILTPEYIEEQLGLNLIDLDPEISVFHPACVVNDIYKLADLSYDKSRGDIEAIASRLDLDDYCELYYSDKCQSFNTVYDNI